MNQRELLEKIDQAVRDGRTELNLANKDLFFLPVEIGQLKNLTRLDLSYNILTSLPTEIGQLKNLTKLYLGNNKLTSLPAEIGQLKDLTELYLHNNNLTSLPAKIGQLKNLKILRLDSNNLTSLPAEIGQLKNLTKLYLDGTKLTSLPAEIVQLKNLTTLDLGNNNLTSLPAKIVQLKNLTKLYLGCNNLASLLAKIVQLKNLKVLDLFSNNLTSLPAEIGQLKNLTELHLGNNKLTSLPAEIGQLKDLTLLDLGGNQLISLPVGIGQLKNLKAIDLYDNPLKEPPPEVAEQGIDAIRVWFTALDAEGGRKLNEVKVLLVGYGGAGKTSLVRRLIKNEFNKNESKTHGVNIDDWPIQVDGEDIMVHLWDYGGQGIMQATHRVFFTHRSLYLLAIDARQESDPEEWLKNIESMGGGSPVMVVINKTDEHKFGLNEPELVRKYPNIKGFYHVSCKSGDGIEGFKEHLKEQIGRVEVRGINWPVRWANVRQRIGKLKDDYISYSRYEEICGKEGVAAEEMQRKLVGILHELGVMLHFPDRALDNIEILNPGWATRGIYKVINSQELKENGGKLKRRRLAYIFNKERLADQKGRIKQYTKKERDHIIELMKKFELCYELDDSAILVPDLLNEKEPADVPQGADVRFYFEYDFMPAVVLPRFIVQSNKDIDPELCWRTGAVLRSDVFDSVAVVRQNKHEGRIYINLKGGNARGYLEVIRDRIDGINKSFAKLPCTEWIPLPDFEQAVEYEELLGYWLDGRDEYYNGKLRKTFPVQKLLDGIENPEVRRMKDERGKTEIYNIKGDLVKGTQNKMRDNFGEVVFGDKNIKMEYNNEYGLSPDAFAELIKGMNRLSADQQQQLKEPIERLPLAQTEKEKESLSQRIKDHLVSFGIGVAGSLTASGVLVLASKLIELYP